MVTNRAVTVARKAKIAGKESRRSGNSSRTPLVSLICMAMSRSASRTYFTETTSWPQETTAHGQLSRHERFSRALSEVRDAASIHSTPRGKAIVVEPNESIGFRVARDIN